MNGSVGRSSLSLSSRSDDGGGRGGDLRVEVRALLRHRPRDRGPLHLATVVDDDASVVLEVHEGTVLAAPSTALAHDNAEHHLLAELGLTLLHSREEAVPERSRRHAVQASPAALDRHHMEVLRTGVVSAVEDRRNLQRRGDAELRRLTRASTLRHDSLAARTTLE